MAEKIDSQQLFAYMRLTDRLINDASKEKIAEALRIFALEIAYYQARFGALPTGEAVGLLKANFLSEEQTGWVANSLENVAAMLVSIPDEEPEELLH